MIGEFEYTAIFNDGELEFPSVTYILFIAFVIIMSIIIVNLMIGLAVDDIKAVQEQAILKRLAMQAELILDVERLLPEFILKKRILQFETIRQKPKKWWHFFKDVISSMMILKDAADIGKADDDKSVADTLNSIQETIRNLDSELKTLALENKKMLKALTKKNNISLDN